MPAIADDHRLNLKGKGDLAELMVATDLRRRSFKIAIAFGEDCEVSRGLLNPRHSASDACVS